MPSIDALFAELTQAQANKSLPPVQQWSPEREGQIDIRIDSEGLWYHEGRQILRQPLVNLFATILRRDDEQYYLVTPAEKLQIVVEDAPFVATDLDVRGEGDKTELLFTTNVGDYIVADVDHPISIDEGRPYVLVRDDLLARLTRSVYYRLVEYGAEDGGRWFVISRGARFCLGAVEPE